MRLQARFSHFKIGTGLTAALLMFSVISCAALRPSPIGRTGRAFKEAEELFHQDPRWLGADVALSVPLGNGRTVWLFGDTFVAKTDAHVRSESDMVRNTIAIQTGDEPRTASMTFHWRHNVDGSPASFFPDPDNSWFWPGHGIRVDEGPLVIFLYATVATPGIGLGFATTGYSVAVIDNPDTSPEMWEPRIVQVDPSAFDAVPATAVVLDGAYVVAVAIRQEGTHTGALVRYSTASLAQGDASGAEWWTGSEGGWVRESLLGSGGPAFVLDDAGSECSLHWDERTGSYVHIASYGFGASTIGLRTAPYLTGPWSKPMIVYRPPESDGPRPFVYAAKGHPELVGLDPADLVLTYVTNSFRFDDLISQQGRDSLYWPRMVLVRLER